MSTKKSPNRLLRRRLGDFLKIDVVVGDAQVSIGSSNYVYVAGRDTRIATAINKTTATQGNSSTGLEGPICLVQVADGEIQVMIEPKVLDESKISSFKNNFCPQFSDEECITVYLWGISQRRFEQKTIYEYTQNHLLEWFPKLSSYQAFSERLNRLAPAFQALAEIWLGLVGVSFFDCV